MVVDVSKDLSTFGERKVHVEATEPASRGQYDQ
jgi:hypothetical protein